MSEKTVKPKRKKTATYHDAAFAAFNYLLREYKFNGDVELFDEHQLSKRPLKIDIMIVKKNLNVEIKESWGNIFREYNVIEYKSPVDKPVSLVADKMLAIQFIISSELEDSVVVLKALRAKIDEATAKKVLELPVEDDKYQVSLSQWWEVLLIENKEILSEEENMGKWEDVIKTLNKKGILDNFKNESVQEGMQKVLDLWKNGMSFADAEKMVMAR